MTRHTRGLAALLLVAAFAGSTPLAAQEAVAPAPPPAAGELVRVAEPVQATAARGANVEVTIPFTVLAGWHINAHRPNEEFLVPTVLTLRGGPGVRVGTPRYPEPRNVTLSFSETPLAVYEENAAIVVPLTIEGAAAEGARKLSGTLNFQACNNEVCLPPANVP
ncbi:MAG: protein-disulfide reductase DsbD domain-containing protein, partial [Candidatus Eisenbacteria bacterium]